MKEPSLATRQFILNHAEEDVRALALRGCKDQDVDFRFALQQIEGRQKAKEKLPHFYTHHDIIYPTTLSMEQCSSLVTAQYKASLLQGNTLADLSGGFGVDTFAFAQHFAQCLHIEPQAELSNIAAHNACVLGIANINFHVGTLEEHLPTLPLVDYIFIDPSRRDSQGGRVVSLGECTPNILQYKDTLLQKARHGILVKLSPMIDLKQTLHQLPETCAIHVVALNNECKEVLFLLQPSVCATPSITAVHLQKDGTSTFLFTPKEEQEAIPTLSKHIENYLYEPNVALLKAGAFKMVACRYHLKKLHPHSHLYTHHALIENFPGRVFCVDELLPYNKRSLKSLVRTKANVATRNFPLSAEALKKELKIQDGGEVYLFGTTLTGDERVLLKTHKIK